MTFSSAFRCPNSRMFWKVREMPIAARPWAGKPVTSRPSKTTRPASGRITPVIRLNSVVLPAPFGPTTETTCAGCTAKPPRSTATSPPKRRVSPSTASSGAEAASDSVVGSAAVDLDHHHLGAEVVALGRVLEAHLRADRGRDLERGERLLQLCPVDGARLLQRLGDAGDGVGAVGRERGRLLLELRPVALEEVLEHRARRLQVLGEPGVVALHLPLGAVPVDRVLEGAEAGEHGLGDAGLADLGRDLDAVAGRAGDVDGIGAARADRG